jgi:hypothetical protein
MPNEQDTQITHRPWKTAGADVSLGNELPITTLDLIREVARDQSVSVDKLERLVALQERQEQREAKAAFWTAMARLSLKLPRVTKRGKIKMVKDGVDKGTLPYAKYEDIDAACRPLLAEEGLMASFSTKIGATGGVVMVLTVAHALGHSEISERPAPPDTGPGRNATQAQGSGESYAKRYLFNAFFNIVTEGADDDGRATGYISDAQKDCIDDLIHQLGDAWTAPRQSKFLEWLGVSKVGEINASDYKRAINFLEAKARESKK